MQMAVREIEIKLEVGPDALRHVLDGKILAERAGNGPVQKHLHATYFDTSDQRLRREKASLRLRHDGQCWRQTLKYGTGVQHGLSNPIECECVVDENKLETDKIDDAELRKWLLETVSGRSLDPAFETRIDRKIWTLDGEGGASLELAVDEGSVRAGEVFEPVSEVELELKSGPEWALLDMAERLFDGSPVEPSRSNKADRGYRLLDGSPALIAASGPVAATMPALNAGMTPRSAMKAFGEAAAAQILGNWSAMPGSDDPEIAHQLRVGLRRMRTTLRLFEPVADDDSLARLAREVRDLGQVVGSLRDADVVIVDIVEPVMRDKGARAGFESLLFYLEQERTHHRKAVHEALNDGRWTWLRLNCMLFGNAVDRAVGEGAEGSASDLNRVAAEALDKSWRHVAEKGRKFGKHTTAQRHEMRKALKTLRYACDFLAPLYADKTALAFTKRLKKLQDVFGYLNDVAMAEHLAEIGDERKDLKKAVAAILKWHRKQAKTASKDAEKRWRELKKSKKFWR